MEDLPLLTAYIVSRLSRKLGRKIDRIADSVLNRLSAYDWPGNVRELENVIERAIILSPGSSLKVDAVQTGTQAAAGVQNPRETAPARAAAVEQTLPEIEKFHILRVCHATGWKIKGPKGAAAILGLNPGTLYSRMKKLGIRRP
jgi:DNA-binding NtrC family response regulator